MNTSLLNYRIIIEKEPQGEGNAYIAYVPTLGISDFGETIDKAVTNIEKAMRIYLDTLIELDQPIPQADTDDYFVTTRKIELHKSIPQVI